MKTNKFIAMILALALGLSAGSYQAQAQQPVSQSNNADGSVRSGDEIELSNLVAQVRVARRSGFALMPENSYVKVSGPVFSITPAAAGANLSVVGSGTVGRLTKWMGFTSSNSVIGDSNIYEDKFGKVGIGTTAPTSLLTVQGVIETVGGIKFADGTTQTTSTAGALFGVAHDSTLQGNGTLASPLRVAVPLITSGNLSNLPVISATNVGTGGGSVGVSGTSASGFGVMGSSTIGEGVFGSSTNGGGVQGISTFGSGVRGASTRGTGVSGLGITGDGVSGQGGTDFVGNGGIGVVANGGSGITGSGGDGVIASGGSSASSFGGQGIRADGGSGSGVGKAGGDGIVAASGIGSDGATNGRAGRFIGNVQVTGDFSATGVKMFKIDHPSDPENKYLNHAAIESSEVLNVYSGNTTTDQNGDAIVSLPDWFEALNKDPRYQLTVIGTFAQAIVADEIKGNRFVIKSNAPNVKVSWQVTGVRSDAGMKKYPFKAEEEKAEGERGYYLTPEVFNQPEEKSIEWARNPEMMRRLKQRRVEAEQMRNRR